MLGGTTSRRRLRRGEALAKRASKPIDFSDAMATVEWLDQLLDDFFQDCDIDTENPLASEIKRVGHDSILIAKTSGRVDSSSDDVMFLYREIALSEIRKLDDPTVRAANPFFASGRYDQTAFAGFIIRFEQYFASERSGMLSQAKREGEGSLRALLQAVSTESVIEVNGPFLSRIRWIGYGAMASVAESAVKDDLANQYFCTALETIRGLDDSGTRETYPFIARFEGGTVLTQFLEALEEHLTREGFLDSRPESERGAM